MREGVPDELDPVRRARDAAASTRASASRSCSERGETGAQLYLDGADGNGIGGAGAFFLLLDEPEVYGLPPDPVDADAQPAAVLGRGARARRRSSPAASPPRCWGTRR